MSVIEALNDNDGSVPREVVDAFVQDLADLASRLSPEAQARLMGFVHLVDDPAAIEAELKVGLSGEITLVLRHPPTR